jgi:hypothetical protein
MTTLDDYDLVAWVSRRKNGKFQSASCGEVRILRAMIRSAHPDWSDAQVDEAILGNPEVRVFPKEGRSDH